MSWRIGYNWSSWSKTIHVGEKRVEHRKRSRKKRMKNEIIWAPIYKAFVFEALPTHSIPGSISPFTDSLANSRCCHGSLLRRSIEFESDPDFLQCTCQPSGQYFDFRGGGSLNHGSIALDVESSWNIISQKSHLTRCFNDFQWKRKLRQAKIIRYLAWLTWSWMSQVKSIEVSKRNVLSIAILKVIRDDPQPGRTTGLVFSEGNGAHQRGRRAQGVTAVRLRSGDWWWPNDLNLGDYWQLGDYNN